MPPPAVAGRPRSTTSTMTPPPLVLLVLLLRARPRAARHRAAGLASLAVRRPPLPLPLPLVDRHRKAAPLWGATAAVFHHRPSGRRRGLPREPVVVVLLGREARRCSCREGARIALAATTVNLTRLLLPALASLALLRMLTTEKPYAQGTSVRGTWPSSSGEGWTRTSAKRSMPRLVMREKRAAITSSNSGGKVRSGEKRKRYDMEVYDRCGVGDEMGGTGLCCCAIVVVVGKTQNQISTVE